MRIYEDYYREIRTKSGAIARIRTTVPDNFNFAYDVTDRYAVYEPDRIAMVHKDVDGHLRELSFRELKRLSDRAAAMLAELGVKRGTAVMLLLKRRCEFWIAMLALHKLGAVAVPTSHMVSAEDIAQRVRIAGVKMILCVNSEHICEKAEEAISAIRRDNVLKSQGDCVADNRKHDGTGNRENVRLDEAGAILAMSVGAQYPGFLFWDELMERQPETVTIQRVETKVNDPMLYYFTSGTNGAPKAVIHDWSYPIAHIYTAKQWHGIREGDLHITVADSGWAKTAWGKLYGQWFLGARILVYDYDRFYAGEFLSLLTELKVNTFCAPPTIYKYLVMEDLTRYDWSSLRCATTAGEPMPSEVARAFTEATGISVRSGFGQTETALQICTPIPNNAEGAGYDESNLDALIKAIPGTRILAGRPDAFTAQVPGSIGKASPLYHIEIVDDQGKPVADGIEGEIAIIPRSNERPIGIFSGYLGDPERYRDVWRGGIYHTGDRAWKDAGGNIFFIGRGDDVIKSSGYRIGPSEVEDVLLRHPAVRFCAVTGYPSHTRGTVVKASIVLKEGFAGDRKLTAELQDFVKTHGAVYKYPRIIAYVDDLPRTANGKINRAAIRKADEAAVFGASRSVRA